MPKNVIEDELTLDCDGGMNSTNSMKYYRTNDNTANLPPNLGLGEHDGSVVFFNTHGNQNGVQYFYQHLTGDIYARTKMGTVGNWSKIASSHNIIENAVLKPEVADKLGDANEPPASGIFRTYERSEADYENPNGTLNLPSGVGKWGVLQNFFENPTKDSNGRDVRAGFQLYSPIDGVGFGSLYVRAFGPQARLGTEQCHWIQLKLKSLSEIQDSIFTYPSQEATNINEKNENGFHVTTSSTLGDFPEGVNKHGIIKTLKTPAGYLRQTYTPLEGPYAGYNFTRVKERTVTRDGRNVDMWAKWQDGQSHVKIMNNRDAQVPNPSTYKAKATGGAGFIFHEWKFTSATGMGLPSGEQAGRCILTTYVPTPTEEDTRTDFSDLVQFAFIKDGAVYKRNGSNIEDAWGEWKGIPVGQQPSGGGIQLQDVTAHYINLFNTWAKTATE